MSILKPARAFACLTVLLMLTGGAMPAQSSNPTGAKPSPELVGQLTKELSVTPAQATGGAGALFGVAKKRLSAADFSKVAAAVPGMGGFLKAAPSTSNGGLGSLAGSLPGGASGLASTAASFQKLGLSPDMVQKFVPILTKFVEGKAGASTAALLAGGLK